MGARRRPWGGWSCRSCRASSRGGPRRRREAMPRERRVPRAPTPRSTGSPRGAPRASSAADDLVGGDHEARARVVEDVVPLGRGLRRRSAARPCRRPARSPTARPRTASPARRGTRPAPRPGRLGRRAAAAAARARRLQQRARRSPGPPVPASATRSPHRAARSNSGNGVSRSLALCGFAAAITEL